MVIGILYFGGITEEIRFAEMPPSKKGISSSALSSSRKYLQLHLFGVGRSQNLATLNILVFLHGRDDKIAQSVCATKLFSFVLKSRMGLRRKLFTLKHISMHDTGKKFSGEERKNSP